MKFQVNRKKGGRSLALCEVSLGVLGKTLEFAVTRGDFERVKSRFYDHLFIEKLLSHLPRKRSAKAANDQSTEISRRNVTAKKSHDPTTEGRSRSSGELNSEDGP